MSDSFANFKLPFDRQTVYNFIKEESVNSLLEKQAVSFEKIKEDFTKNSTSKNDKIKLMVGAKEVLDWTQKENIQNFIYTHKGKNAFDLLKQLGISSYFLEVVTSENNFKRKPNPEAINYLVKKYNLKMMKPTISVTENWILKPRIIAVLAQSIFFRQQIHKK